MTLSNSPLRDSHGSLSHSGNGSYNNNASIVPARPYTRENPAIISTYSPDGSAVGAAKLMQKCTNMLKEHMFLQDPSIHGGDSSSSTGRFGSPAGPENAVKALGPVLEGVLGTLTEEYEKRLLAKDHELSRMCDAKAKLEKEVDRLQVGGCSLVTSVQRLLPYVLRICHLVIDDDFFDVLNQSLHLLWDVVLDIKVAAG